MYTPTEFLSPEDFEKFINEIIKIKFNKKIHSFSSGPDDGIDGIDDSANPSMIVQSKRYMSRMSSSTLEKKVKEEIEKIINTIANNKWNNNIDYVIATSASLTPKSRRELRLFKNNFISSEEFIIDSNDLESMSRIPEYKKIFEDFDLINKNLIDQINKNNLRCHKEESSNYFTDFNIDCFVETNNFRKSYELLNINNICILSGNPGVGKTTLCKALAYTFCSRKDVKVYVLEKSISDIQEIKNIINNDFTDEKNLLLVVFDDFLGRNYLEANDSDLKKLNTLLGIIYRKNNIYFILNSRTEIINKAQINSNFTDFMYKNEENNLTVDVNDYSKIEKSLIIRKLIEEKYFSSSKHEKDNIKTKYSELLVSKLYKNVVFHKNYNPRLITLVIRRISKLEENFADYFIKKLNDPSDIYEELFENLSEEAKYFLFILYSFESYPVEQKKLIEVYNQLRLESTKDIFIIINELKDSWIKSEVNYLKVNQIIYIQFVNPSIYDYLQTKIKKVYNINKKIKDNIVYLGQAIKIGGKDFLYKNINKTFDDFSDKSNYFGEKIYNQLILNNKKYDTLEEDLVNFNKGWFYDNTKYQFNGIHLAIEILNSELESDFIELILFSKQNEVILNNLIEYDSSNIDDFIMELNASLEKIYDCNLKQNELIDNSEEETSVNLFHYLLNIKVDNVQTEINSLDDIDLINDLIDNTIIENYSDDYLLDDLREDIKESYVDATLNKLELDGYEEYIDNFEDLDYSIIDDYIDERINNLFYDYNDRGTDFGISITNDLTIEEIFEKPLDEKI